MAAARNGGLTTAEKRLGRNQNATDQAIEALAKNAADLC